MEKIEMAVDQNGELPTADFCRAIDRVRAGTASLQVTFPDPYKADAFYKKAMGNFPELSIDWGLYGVCTTVCFSSSKHKVVSI